MAALKQEGAGNVAFDQREYDELRIHYFEPVVQHNVQLPGGRVLRKQTSPPRIDQKGRGYDALRKQIAELEKKKDKVGVWHLLRQLRAWEMRPPSLGGTALTGGAAQDGVNVVIDLSVENHAMDVDAFICDVLLTKVVKVKTDPDGNEHEVRLAAPAPFPKRIKPDPDDAPAAKKARTAEGLVRSRKSKPTDEVLQLGRDVGKQMWRLVLDSEPERQPVVPLDLAKLDALLKRCPTDALPLETTSCVLGESPPPYESNWAMKLYLKEHRDIKALRFTAGAADRAPSYDAEIDQYSSAERSLFSDKERRPLRAPTLVEWLCRKDDEADADWVCETLRALMERGAMVTADALSAAEAVKYNRGHPVVESNLVLKAKLLSYMLSQCPGILTKTRRNLDYYAKIVHESHEESGENYVAFDVLERLTDSPDVYDAFAYYPWASPEREAAPQRLSKLLRSNAALRPPPIEPEAGVTHAAGGHFSRWHDEHVKIMNKKVEELKGGATARAADSGFLLRTFARAGVVYDAILLKSEDGSHLFSGTLETKGAFRMELQCHWVGQGLWEVRRGEVPGAVEVLPVDGGKMLTSSDAADLEEEYDSLTFRAVPDSYLRFEVGDEWTCKGDGGESVTVTAQKDDIIFCYEQCMVIAYVLFRPRRGAATGGNVKK